MSYRAYLDSVIEIAKMAGERILDIYNDADLSEVVDYKADDSPLTLADKASNEVIVPGLKAAYPLIPILSEESKQIPYEERKNWKTFWLVDPLDGTKEFIKKNGEFTVNIALIHDGLPMLGVIYVPAKDITYFGVNNEDAFKQEGDAKPANISVNNKSRNRIAVRSRSHASPEEDELLEKYGVTDSISVGSSLKFCMVAEGKADIYYRHGPTMEWDTAAGHAILAAAGGRVFKGNEAKEPFTYNKQDLLNPSFLCLGF
jgi:3'(2'), 5'-bisphosphate nucleotidase